MAKVGQIYEYENVGLFVITNKQDIDDKNYNYSIIWQDGSVDAFKIKKSMEIYGKLINEYQTWNEAINSIEFKGKK